MHSCLIYRLLSIFLVLMLVVTLGSCGQKGDLFLEPEDEKEEPEESEKSEESNDESG